MVKPSPTAAVVPRTCDDCGYRRFAREVENAPLKSPGDVISSWPWVLWIVLLPLFPLFLLWLAVWPLVSRHRINKYFQGLQYEQFARCPLCGSDRVRTESATGFVPTAGALHATVLPCPSCGTKNRVVGPGRRRCGRCQSDFIVTRTP